MIFRSDISLKSLNFDTNTVLKKITILAKTVFDGIIFKVFHQKLRSRVHVILPISIRKNETTATLYFQLRIPFQWK